MSNEVSFIIKIDDKGSFKKVTVDADGLGKAIRSVQDEAEKAKRATISWAETAQALDVMQNAISDLHDVMADLTHAYQIQLVAETQLETIMRQRMTATDEEVQSIKDLCSAQQELGVIGDEVQLSGAQQMATFLNSKKSLDVLIPAMNNLLAQQNGLNATNEAAVSIGNMMGKAMQGQVEVLQRVGITFDEAQKQVLQFGDESERAAMLAKVITANVGDMNARLAMTDAGRQQQLENTLGDIKEELGQVMQRYSKWITMAAQTTTTITGLVKLHATIKSIASAFGIGTVAMRAWNATAVSMNALMQVCSATMRGTAVSTRTLTLAVRGLMIASGAGLAVTALTMAISRLAAAESEASPAADGLSQAEEAAVAASAEAKTAIDGEISRLRQLIQAKKDTSTAVGELNQRYGEAFGYHKTAAQWYDTLTSKSQTYIRQLGYEAQAKALASRMAENDIRLQNNYDKRRELWQKGQAQTTTVQYMGGTPGTQGTYRTARQDTDQYKALKQQGAELLQQQREYRRQWDIVSGRLRQTAADMRAAVPAAKAVTQAATPPAASTATPAAAAEADPLEGSIDWYEKRIRELRTRMEATADEAVAADLRRQTEAAEKELSELKIRIGIEAPAEPELKTRLARLRDRLDRAQADFDDAATIEAKVKADARIADLQRQISEATRGKLSIEADIEPSYVTRGSAADRRQSYANAQQRARRIQQDYEIGLTGQDEARKQMEELNAEIGKLGLKPVTIDIRTRGFDQALGRIREGWSAVSGIGSGIESMTEALKGNGNAWQTVSAVVGGFLQAAEGITAVVRIVEALSATTRVSTAATAATAAATTAATTATTASGAANAAATATAVPLVAANKLAAASYMEMAAAAYMAAHAYIPFAGFGIGASFAASAKALVTAIGATPFADGGLVYGPTLALMGEYAGARSNPEVIAPLSKLQSIIGEGGGGGGGAYEFRVKGNDLVAVLANQTRSQRRKSNIRI